MENESSVSSLPQSQPLFPRPKIPGYEFEEKQARGRFRIYEWPKPGVLYAIGADVSEGKIRDGRNSLSDQLLQGKHTPDFSAVCVLNCVTLHQVAAYSSLELPDQFTRKLYGICQLYKNHILAIEANSMGIAVINGAEALGERRFYNRRVYDKTNRTYSNMKGFKTTSSSREQIINQFRISLQEENGVVLNDPETISQFLTIKYNNNGKPEAAAGCYDDEAFAAMIAYEARRAFYRPQIIGEVKYKDLPAYERKHWIKMDQLDEASQNQTNELESSFSPGLEAEISDSLLED